MLAERRKKIRYSNNPCGNLWANDRRGFGRQMLERLGWIPGNGLGKNGNGIEKPIKASAKNDRRGLGKQFEYALGNNQQLEEYAKLLKSLNKSYSTVKRSTTTPLENISGSSSTRLHYPKFVRAKDTSKYDNKALKVILGGTLEEREEEEKNTGLAAQPGDLADPTQHSESFEFGIKTITSGVSMTDYFKKKLLSLKAKNTVQERNAPKTECAAECTNNSKSTRKKRKHSGTACTDQNTKSFCSLNSVASESEEPIGECPPPPLHEFGVSEVPEEPRRPTTSCSSSKSDFSLFEKGFSFSPFSKTNLLSIPGYQLY